MVWVQNSRIAFHRLPRFSHIISCSGANFVVVECATVRYASGYQVCVKQGTNILLVDVKQNGTSKLLSNSNPSLFHLLHLLSPMGENVPKSHAWKMRVTIADASSGTDFLVLVDPKTREGKIAILDAIVHAWREGLRMASAPGRRSSIVQLQTFHVSFKLILIDLHTRRVR